MHKSLINLNATEFSEAPESSYGGSVMTEVEHQAEITYDIQPREGWPPGPWDDEPDKLVWIDPETGLDCMVVRARLGHLCGYVGVPPEHPFFEIWYDSLECSLLDANFGLEAHGGLTYSNHCQGHICHTPKDGRPDHVWWFGFDCGHVNDISPGMDSSFSFEGAYRDVDYVTDNVTLLAKNIAKATEVLDLNDAQGSHIQSS